MFIKQTGSHVIDIIPFSKVNRVNNSYEFYIDTNWLIPQEYYLEVKLKSSDTYKTYETKRFKIVSEI